MTKEELIQFIKDNYGDIEASPLPKLVGSLPPEERLIKKTQLDKLIKKAETSYGETFANFLTVSVAKGSLPQNKRKLWFFWLDEDNWDFMYKRWLAYKESPTV